MDRNSPEYCWRFILDLDGNPVMEPDLLKWAAWFEERGTRIVRQTVVRAGKIIEDVTGTTPKKPKVAGDILVSTVFLSLDHGWGTDKPVLWETMMFPDANGCEYQERYSSKEDALIGHQKAVDIALQDSIKKI